MKANRRGLCTIAAVAALVFATAAPIWADNNEEGGFVPMDLGGATTGSHARLAAIIDDSATNFVMRSKGVAEVLHPATGQWCIRPSGTWDVNKVVPIVSVEWSNSSGSALLAFYRSSGAGCTAGYINIVTYNFNGGTPVLSDSVSFMIVVP